MTKGFKITPVVSEIKPDVEFLETFGDQESDNRRAFNRSTEGRGLAIPH